jgi:hypothetical protein
MIGSIRKHSKWLWIVIAGLTIISFVVFMGSGPARSGGRAVGGGLGTIYGLPVTAQDFAQAQGAFSIYHWMHTGQWPEKSGMTREEQEREIYIRILLAKKAAQLGVHAGESTLVAAAAEFLRQIGRGGQAVPMQQFERQVLAPEHLGVNDLQNFLREELVIQQLVQTLGLPGAFVTPQEAGLLYDRRNQEVSAEAVFFSASNYLSQITAAPAAVAQFYTNNMAAYREPDRVQVSYVFFDVTNFLAQSKAEWEKTNFTEYVEAVYRQYGQSQFADAKTPEEAKAKIRELVIRERALEDARQSANAFAAALFAMEPPKPENLATMAGQKGMAIRTTSPFPADYGPEDINTPPAFTRAAFQLNADEPFAGPIAGPNGVYVIALAGRMPSMIPALPQILPRVTRDYQEQQAVALAQKAGADFQRSLAAQMAAGSSFAKAAVAAGHAPLALPPFSLSTASMAELEGRAMIEQAKQAAFTTPIGHVSDFVPTQEGGFVLFVREMLPVNQAKKNAELSQFILQYQRERQGEAFNLWLMSEANRELRNTPYYQKQVMGKKPQS